MNYTKKSFSVTGPGTKSYADNWERTFRKKAELETKLEPVFEAGGTIAGVTITTTPMRGKVKKLVRRNPTDMRAKVAPNWIGPWPSDLKEGVGQVLKQAVPEDRWPYGPPEFHEGCCILQTGGLYCDCKASAADEPDWGYGG